MKCLLKPEGEGRDLLEPVSIISAHLSAVLGWLFSFYVQLAFPNKKGNDSNARVFSIPSSACHRFFLLWSKHVSTPLQPAKDFCAGNKILSSIVSSGSAPPLR